MRILTQDVVKSNTGEKLYSEQKWTQKKERSDVISAKLRKAGYSSRAQRIQECGIVLSYTHCPECGRYHVTRANLCRDRLCPICGWRLSVKRFGEMTEVLQQMGDLEGRTVSMLTLTVRNVKPDDLRETIRELANSWRRMTQRKVVADELYGWARSVEITYNRKTGEFHPHLHVFMIWQDRVQVDKYLGKFREMWRKSAKLNYSPIIDLREAYDRQDGNEVIRAALEAFKYIAKSSQLERMSSCTLGKFAEAVKGFRFVSFGGEIKRLRGQLGMDDQDQANEIDQQDIVCSECTAPLMAGLARWAGCYYVDSDSGEAVKL